MPPIINIELDCDDSDGRRTIVIIKGKDYPEIDSATEQKFIDLIAPLELPNPKGVYLLAHHIKYGELIDNDELAQWVKPGEYDWEMLSLMEMLLEIGGWKDVGSMRIGYKLISTSETRSISLNNKKFYEKLTQSVLFTYLKTFAPTYIVKEYAEKKYKWPTIIKHEVARLRKLKEHSAKQFSHRPTSNKRIYCMLLLFFDILALTPNKDNCNLMIHILQLMGLWKEGLTVDETKYKLIIRQWKTAQMYKLMLMESGFPNRDVDFAGIEGLSFR